ncbi:MAG TPA: HdeD family acid-resistance protein [Gemmatimonadaceae bacterium]
MPQVSEMTSNWWALALRGAVSILLGLVAITMPGLTIAAIVTVFGVYAIIEGVLAIMASIRGIREHDRWGWMMVEGVVGICAGLIAFFMPGVGALAIIWLIAAWAVLTGALEIAAGFRLRKIIEGEWLLILTGVLAIVLGFFMVSRPGMGVVLLTTWLGVWAILSGITLMVLAFRIKRWANEHA